MNHYTQREMKIQVETQAGSNISHISHIKIISSRLLICNLVHLFFQYPKTQQKFMLAATWQKPIQINKTKCY